MAELQTIEEIEAEYTTGWVLIGDAEVDDLAQLRRWRVLFHSHDRDAVYARSLEFAATRVAIRCLTPIAEGMELAISIMPVEDIPDRRTASFSPWRKRSDQLRDLLHFALGHAFLFTFQDGQSLLAEVVSNSHLDLDDTVIIVPIGTTDDQPGYNVELWDIRSLSTPDGHVLYQAPDASRLL